MGFAILWIMIFHYPTSTNIFILDLLKSYGYAGVDIFLFLSGFGLYFSLSKKNLSLGEFYKKRFIRVLPVFWLFLIVLFVITRDYSLKSFWELLCCMTTLGYWVKVIPYKLWYISCILFFYAIFPFYFNMYKKHGSLVDALAIGIGLILTAIYALVMVFVFDNRNEGGTLVMTIARIPIFFIGSMFGHWAKDGCNIQLSATHKVISLCALGFGVFLLYFFSVRFSDYQWTCSLFFLPLIIITPVLCVILAVLFEKLPAMITKLFANIGMISLELFMVHVYMYRGLVKQMEQNWGALTTLVVVVSLSFVFAICLYYVNKTYLQKISAQWLKLKS